MVDSARMSISNISWNTPLMQRQATLAGGQLSELPFSIKFSLRGDASDTRFTTSVNTLLKNAGLGDLHLPVEPNTVNASDKCSVLWMGPDEWLLRSNAIQNESPGEDLSEESFSEAFSGQHAAVVDVSDYYTVLELQSPNAIEWLSRSCPLDLETEFPATDSSENSVSLKSACAQTRMGNASVLLDKKDAECWRIQVRWSYAQYLWQLLQRSAISL